jgi:hypothetical protein
MIKDKKYSKTAQMKYASHVNPRTFGQSYTHPICEVDGPASYLNIKSCHEHIQNRRSMGLYFNPKLCQSLPAKAEFEFQDCEDILALDKELAELSTQLENTDSAESMREIQLQQQRIQGQKDKLYLGEPKRQYQLQPDNQSRSIHEHMLFYYYQQVMPERDLLADILPARQRYRAWLNWMLSKH